MKQYKLISQNDSIFNERFDLTKLQNVINDHAKKGWVVRTFSTAKIPGLFGNREQIIVLLESNLKEELTITRQNAASSIDEELQAQKLIRAERGKQIAEQVAEKSKNALNDIFGE